MRKILSLALLLGGVFVTVAQTITLTFTGLDTNNNFIPLDRVVIADITQNWQETLYYPDTTLTMGQVGIKDHESIDGFGLQQNNPNPFEGTTYATLRTVEPGDVVMILTDVNGRIVETKNFASLPAGIHQFRINVAHAGTCMLTARQKGESLSIKMVNKGNGAINKIECLNSVASSAEMLRTISLQSSPNNPKGSTNYPFSMGDEMIYTGYVIVDGMEYQSVTIHQNQYDSENLTLNFSVSVHGYPCPDMPTVTDHEGNVYNTVQVGTQCWMKENMRCTTSPSTGTMMIEDIPSSSYTGKKAYYVNGSPSNADTYGLLYNWNAAVDTFSISYGEISTNDDYTNAVSVTFSGNRRGICPQGWHIPTDAEWTVLTEYVSDQSEFQCDGDRDNIAKALASTMGWNGNSDACTIGNDTSANNATGFSALPTGYFNGTFANFGNRAYLWSTTSGGSAMVYTRNLYCYDAKMVRYENFKACGFAVRCLRD